MEELYPTREQQRSSLKLLNNLMLELMLTISEDLEVQIWIREELAERKRSVRAT